MRRELIRGSKSIYNSLFGFALVRQKCLNLANCSVIQTPPKRSLITLLMR